MNKVLTGFCALLLLTGLTAACNDSDRVGGNPGRERTPSASPPTSPDTGRSTGTSPSPSPAPSTPPATPNR
jgi:hypothetical protein